jgi:hypothetical protein
MSARFGQSFSRQFPVPIEKSELAHRLATAGTISGEAARFSREGGLDSHNLYYGTKCSNLGGDAESALSYGSHSRLALSDAV